LGIKNLRNEIAAGAMVIELDYTSTPAGRMAREFGFACALCITA